MYKEYRSKGKWWGLLLVLAGIFVVLSQLGIIPSFGWRDVIGVALLAVAVVKICYLEFWNIATPTLMGIWFLSGSIIPLNNWLEGTSWIAFLIAGLLIDGGLSYLLKPKFKYHGNYYKKKDHIYRNTKDDGVIDVEVSSEDEKVFTDFESEDTSTAQDDTSVFYVNAKMGSTTRYINTSSLREVYVNASLAGVELYFNRSKIKNGEAYLNIDASMAGLEIYVPREWTVRVQVSPVMGGVEEVGASTGDGSQILYVMGKIHLGGIEIIYV